MSSIICENLTIDNAALINRARYPRAENFVKIHNQSDPSSSSSSSSSSSYCILPEKYKQLADVYYNFEVRKDDIWIITYPKSGTTWTQQMIWLLAYDLNFEMANRVPFSKRTPFLEFDVIYDNQINDSSNVSPPSTTTTTTTTTPILNYILSKEFNEINNNGPRVIKSHLPLSLLPKQLWTICPKIIYVSRNPKDVAISYYHHYVNVQGYAGTLNEFLELFLNDILNYSPFHEHTIQFWNIKNQYDNLMFLTYEEMIDNLLGVIKRTASFLGKSVNHTDCEKLKSFISFNKMRTDIWENNLAERVRADQQNYKYPIIDKDFKFLRKGKNCTFKEEMSNEMIEKFNQWTDTQLNGLDFKYTI